MARLTLNGMFQYDETLFDGMILPEGYDRDALFAEIMTRSGQLYPYHQVPSILKSNIRLWFARNYLNFDRTMAALTAEYDPIENYNRHEQSTKTPNLTDKSTLSGKDTAQASGNDITTHSEKDTLTRAYNDYKETVTRSYDDYKETVTYSGDDTRETQVSAFDSSSYQPSEKVTDSRTNREDEKEISGSHADDKEIAGSYSDETAYGHKITLANGRKDETTYGKVDTVTHTGTEGYSSHIHGNIGVTTSQQMIESELELRKIDIYDDIAARFEREFLVQVY